MCLKFEWNHTHVEKHFSQLFPVGFLTCVWLHSSLRHIYPLEFILYLPRRIFKLKYNEMELNYASSSTTMSRWYKSTLIVNIPLSQYS